MHLVVTGGAGFIGSHIVDAFLGRGWKVSIIDDLSTGHRDNVNPNATLYARDLCDPMTMDLLRELQPDVVSHHAAQIDVRRSVVDPAMDASANIVATVRLLRSCVELGVKRFVFSSSGGAIYGEPEYAPQDEDHPTRPLSPYGCSKLAVEHYLDYFREAHGLSTIALRYANAYGPRQSASNETGVVAIFADMLSRGEAPSINGDGEQTRDFMHVSDIVAANLAVIDDPSLTGAFNVGTGVETSINTLYREIAKIAGTNVKPRHAEAKAGEQRRSVIDGNRLRLAAKLPRPLTLREGLERLLAK